MRKLALAVATAALFVGLASADTVTLVKYDATKKVVTVKDEKGKEVDLKLTEKTKVVRVDKDGNKKESDIESAAKMLGNEKLAGKAKFDVTIVDGAITEMVLKGGKGK